MKNAIIAVAAFAASVVAQGSAIVQNSCSYSVSLANVPSADGGGVEFDETLEAGKTYSQPWTTLTNGNGWSLKLTDPQNTSNIIQFEYTYQTSDLATVWYDISEVNGYETFNGDWFVSSDMDSCTPEQISYANSTDNTAMQGPCECAASITLTLCSSDSTTGSSSSVSSASATATTSTAVASSSYVETTTSSSSYVESATTSASSSEVATTTSAPVSESSVSSTKSYGDHPWTRSFGIKEAIAVTATSSATTLQTTVATTSVSTSDDADVVTVVEMTTAIATHWVYPSKRAEHVHQHAARHPHGGRS